MAVRIEEKVRALIEDQDTVKVLASIDKNGVPHVTYKNSLFVYGEDTLAYYEVIETSQTNKNLVHSIWFDKLVAINLLGKDETSYQIKGKPVKAIISGKEFQKYYDRIRAKLGDIDLSAVWLIEPVEIKEETFEKRRKEEEDAHPLLVHLDRLIKQ